MSTTALARDVAKRLRSITTEDRDFDAIHQRAVLQALALRVSFPKDRPLDLPCLAEILGVEIVTLSDMPVAGTAYQVGGTWRIAVSDRLQPSEQLHAALHEFKHILDRPKAKDVEPADHELVADLFATMALAEHAA